MEGVVGLGFGMFDSLSLIGCRWCFGGSSFCPAPLDGWRCLYKHKFHMVLFRARTYNMIILKQLTTLHEPLRISNSSVYEHLNERSSTAPPYYNPQAWVTERHPKVKTKGNDPPEIFYKKNV